MALMPLLIADGVVLPKEPPLSLLARPDGWNQVPVVAGTNRDELKLFLFLDPKRVQRRFWILPRLVDEPSYLATAEHASRMWKATGAGRALLGDDGYWGQFARSGAPGRGTRSAGPEWLP